MNINQVYECERSNIAKFQSKLLVPNYFKKIGLIIFIISITFLLTLSFFSENNEILKLILQKIILVSMLLIALSREKVEDELIEKIRGQAYTAAFICGVIYALVQPFVNYFVTAIVKPDKAVFSELSVFIILWFMLFIYICIFYLLKRTS